MDGYFFRVDHDLLRSEAFQSLGGSAIKVYLVIGLYADFGTGWAYPSVRTIARQAGLSRQTVLTAVNELVRAGILTTNKAPGKSNAYRIIRQAPERPSRRKDRDKKEHQGGLDSLEVAPKTGPESLGVGLSTVPESLGALAQWLGPEGPEARPKRETGTREDDNTSIPIPGTPFRLTAEGRLLVAVDLQKLLTEQGLPKQVATKIASQKDPEAVAKVLLNALYLQSQGKLQNGPGYIRAGIEDEYELLPQVAKRLESRKRELHERLRGLARKQRRREEDALRDSEDAAIEMLLEQLGEDELQELVEKAVQALPAPLVRRNATLSNPFVRAKVYELACGDPAD